jgi:hypothetical protein
VPGFSRHIPGSHLLQRVVAPLQVMVSEPALAGLLDHPDSSVNTSADS